MYKLVLEKTEEPEIKLPTFVASQRKQGNSRKSIYFCFIDYTTVFVWITTNCGKFLKRREYQTCLLRNLYADQEATVRTGHGTTGWFQIGKRVCQGCILSLCLCQSTSCEMAGWRKQAQVGIKRARR